MRISNSAVSGALNRISKEIKRIKHKICARRRYGLCAHHHHRIGDAKKTRVHYSADEISFPCVHETNRRYIYQQHSVFVVYTTVESEIRVLYDTRVIAYVNNLLFTYVLKRKIVMIRGKKLN